jgi:hypothetical protein
VNEPAITVNGTPLSTAQCASVRVAIEGTRMEFAARHDDHPVDRLLSERLAEVSALMYGGTSCSSTATGAASPGPSSS